MLSFCLVGTPILCRLGSLCSGLVLRLRIDIELTLFLGDSHKVRLPIENTRSLRSSPPILYPFRVMARQLNKSPAWASCLRDRGNGFLQTGSVLLSRCARNKLANGRSIAPAAVSISFEKNIYCEWRVNNQAVLYVSHSRPHFHPPPPGLVRNISPPGNCSGLP